VSKGKYRLRKINNLYQYAKLSKMYNPTTVENEKCWQEREI